MKAQKQLRCTDFQNAALTVQFGQELPARLQAISEWISAARLGSSEDLRKIIDEAHKLRGTGGFFGFAAMAELMGQIEDWLSVGMTQLNSDVWQNVAAALAEALTRIGPASIDTAGWALPAAVDLCE